MRFLFLSLMVSTHLWAHSRIVLKYQFGNQVSGTELSIDHVGVVRHAERTCCPPHAVQKNNALLEKTELEHLLLEIEGAKNGVQEVSQGSPTTLGSPSGYLQVLTVEGDEVNISRIERNPTIGSPDKVTTNISQEARAIQDLVEKFLKDH